MAKLYEGKAKIIYETDNPDEVRVLFKDDATAFDGKKKGSIEGKGECNAAISARLFEYLEGQGVPTHYVERLSAKELLCRQLEIIQVEVVARNVAAGSLAKRLGLEEGLVLDRPVLEYYYKSDELGDPLINRYHIRLLELATDEQLDELDRLAWKINELLYEFLDERGLRLVDFKLEFGLDSEGTILLGDEISPDTCRFWDVESGEKLDKDRFRRDLGRVEETYQEVRSRIVDA
jgi:phosphoribosylaminoimidazole-succinocarboxamide synthase